MIYVQLLGVFITVAILPSMAAAVIHGDRSVPTVNIIAFAAGVTMVVSWWL